MAFRIDSAHPAGITGPDNSSSPEKTAVEFGQTLAQTQKLQQKELEDFLDRLNAQGAKLAKSLSLRDLSDFKDMVKGFLRSTFGQSRKLQEESSWDFRGRPKVMARVSRINHSLEELGRQVLSAQAKPLDILAKIDEIRGLIVDLYA